MFPSLVHRFSGIAWKIRVDTSLGILAVETRSADEKDARISAFAYQEGTSLFLEKPLAGGWSFSLDEVAGNFVYLSGFSGKKSPERKGIIALNAMSGEIAWEAHHLALGEIASEGIMVYNPTISPRRFSALSFRGLQIVTAGPFRAQDILIPETTVIQPIGLVHPDEIIGPLWQCRTGRYTIVSFHTAESSGLTHRLRIALDGQVVVDDFLDRHIQKLNPEAFFIAGNCLVYIRHKTEIVTYLL